MNLNNIYEVLTKIENTSSRTEKEIILKQNKDNYDVIETLKFLLNPYIVTGISTKKINKNLKNIKVKGFVMDLMSMFEHLKRHNTGSDGDIKFIQNFIDSQETPELKDFVKKLATKSLRLGLTEKTVNKVLGKGTIPSFAVMLAESYEKKSDKVKGSFYLTLKLDGNRAIVIKENGNVKFFTRKGQEIEGLSQLAEHFAPLPDNWVYDGEILLQNNDNLPSDELFRATQKVVRKDGEKKGLEFWMFDALPLEQFLAGKSEQIYKDRREILDELFEPMIRDSNLLHILHVLYKGNNKSVIPECLKAVEEDGYEGLMLNVSTSYYETKRINGLLKIKTFHSADLLCTGVEEGTGRNEGRLGAILVEYKGGITKVGSGFSDEQREHYYNNPDAIVGSIVEVSYFEESMDDKTKQLSLRFPVFKTVRTDKTTDDIRYY